jgi:DNA-binding PadR family transcriptional regulator
MLYPVLHRLERLGFIEAHWEKSESGRRRKYYRITKRGRTQLAEEREQWKAVDDTLREIWSALALPLNAAGQLLACTFTPARGLCPCR